MLSNFSEYQLTKCRLVIVANQRMNSLHCPQRFPHPRGFPKIHCPFWQQLLLLLLPHLYGIEISIRILYICIWYLSIEGQWLLCRDEYEILLVLVNDKSFDVGFSQWRWQQHNYSYIYFEIDTDTVADWKHTYIHAHTHARTNHLIISFHLKFIRNGFHL